MCGLVGVASVNLIQEQSWINLAQDLLIHRGPNDAGEWWSECGRVGLAHRRLSIVDLSLSGHQPMVLPKLGLSIIFNGEIYNFRELRRELELLGHNFKSHSDTEVLLISYAQWGEDCVNKLNGMFVFAIYDMVKQRLFLARDRAGEKPLFYRLTADKLYFSSELKALLVNENLPKKIDLNALDCYLAMGFVPGDYCILEGYNKLPPAHAMTFSLKNGAVQIWRYWNLPEYRAVDIELAVPDLVAELEFLLENAVGRQLIADVPVGVLLSGGIDSSLVTAMAVRHSRSVRTFSIGFSGHAKFDETPYAQLIARYFGTEHIDLMAEPTSAELLPMLVQQFDEPVADSSMFPTWLASNLVSKHCTVALGGDGGDELFGGYEHYSRLLALQQKFEFTPFMVRKLFAKAAEHLLPLGFAGTNIRTWAIAAGVKFGENLPFTGCHFDANYRHKLMSGQLGYELVAENIRALREPSNHFDLLQRSTRMDFENYLPDDILVKVDRASMMNSIELRSPFLDYKLIEFAFGKIPSSLKATQVDKKILLKQLALKILPPQFELQRKQGFSIPLSNWLKKGPFRDLFWDTLTSSDCLFDRTVVLDLLRGQDRGRRNGERLFVLVQFELWRKFYGASL